MLNTITNTAIVNKSYTSRGLITHRAVTNNLVRATDGTLWAAVRERQLRNDINLYRSRDQGFSWERVFQGSWPTGLGWGGEQPIVENQRANGPFISLQLFEHHNRLIMWHSFYASLVGQVRVWPFVFDTSTGERILDEIEAPPSNAPYYQIGADETAMRAVYNENMIYLVFTRERRITLRTFMPKRITVQRGEWSIGNNYEATFGAYAREDGLVDLALVTRSGSTETVRYRRFDDRSGNFTSEVTVSTESGVVGDLDITRDGAGNLLMTWSTGASVRHAFSSNNGVSWSVGTVGSGGYIDPITSHPTARVHAVGGINGFLLSYVRVNSSGVPRTYVRQIINGLPGEEREIAKLSNPGRRVVGAKFFATPASKRLDISNPGWARVAYQVGEGNSPIGTDTVPVRFGQELLAESAFPERSEVDTSPITPDVPTPNSRLVTVKVLPGPSSNVDYYGEGATGRYTQRMLASFNKIGNDIRILRYDPTRTAETNDRSAYGKPVEFTAKATVTPMSYDSPFAATQDAFETFVERDVRRIHLPPNLHLSRDFILNEGNFLKRTVWTYYYQGNEYEISQVMPHIVKGQITHYSANSYVIGPSHDPFSRTVLPSET